ncbi:hypothetical protein OSB04_023953 [Centaurea solstitialis]|uniref:Uncharacterized protein n=1 Tax=Centaurea solstitialis TaxID=347529 RepID=A0AA38SYK6_9ASTR|nr:hypothetical protein OSB04_023953 [Centaurea solstitialis]
MSRDLLTMGSKSKPRVLQIGEYPQWRVRMIQFLNNIDKTLMVSIQEGSIKPFIDIPRTPETATTPAIEPRRVYKLFQHYNELEKIRAELDEKALTLLMMAIPNDLFNRVDSRNTAKELWDELEKHFQGTERSIQVKLNQAIGAYEGFKALEGETLADSYSRFNIILNDLRRNGMQKSTSEINFKFLKNLNPEWDHYSVNLLMNKNLAEEDLHDLYSIFSQHEMKVKDIVTKQKSISDSLALEAFFGRFFTFAYLKKFGRNLPVSVNFRSCSSSTKMSRDLLSMGSKSKPPVLQIGEYPQWRVRMIQFLNNIDKTLMVSIQEGPIKPFIDIPGTPETATTPAIEPRRVYKLFRHYNELEKIRAEIDDKALTFLTMAIPNDLFNRVDSRKTAKELWDELEKQFQGTERSIQAKLNQAIGAYEGFKALEGETLADSYSRFNIILNDLRRNGMNKSTSEINFKFLKNLNPEWDQYSMNKNLAEEDLHDLYSILSQHEVKVKDIVMKQKSISDSLALLTEKSKSILSSGSKKKSHSKALVTELSDSDLETVEDDSSESDVDLKRVADKLALLSSSIHKRYGKRGSILNPSSRTTKETSTSQRNIDFDSDLVQLPKVYAHSKVSVLLFDEQDRGSPG